MQALVLDPTMDDCALLVDCLRDSGYHTIPVASVRQAREALERDVFDVFVLELILPDGDGLLLCNEVRERLGEKLIVIVISKHYKPMAKATAMQLGADDVVEKPYDGEELMARVDAHRRRRQWYGIS